MINKTLDSIKLSKPIITLRVRSEILGVMYRDMVTIIYYSEGCPALASG